MTYEEALIFLNAPRYARTRSGLTPMRLLLERLDNPQRRLKFVHIAGTNGKGSVAAYTERILRAAGYLTGLFTSPYLIRFTERIRVMGEEIPEARLAVLAERVRRAADAVGTTEEGTPSVFDLITCIAFLYFAEMHCDIVVLETGLGGRIDATNVIDRAEVSVLTTIDFDHMAVLGNTLAQIAAEKAGIIKPRGRVVTYLQRPEIMKVISDAAARQQASLTVVDPADILVHCSDLTGQRFDCPAAALASRSPVSDDVPQKQTHRDAASTSPDPTPGIRRNQQQTHLSAVSVSPDPTPGIRRNLETSLLGKHQTLNAALALAAIDLLKENGWRVRESHIAEGLRETRWMGRLEIVHRAPLILIDGAHNPNGVAALSENLRRLFPGQKLTFVIGFMADKDYAAMLNDIYPLAGRFFTVTPDCPRALSGAALARLLQEKGFAVSSFQTLSQAASACMSLPPSEIVCAFGSLYFLGEFRGCCMDAATTS